MSINSSYIMLHLSAWKSTSCPINNFIIQFKQQGSNEWTLVSNSISPILDHFLVPDLSSGTWYNLLIGAHSDAGSTEAEYLFATLTDGGATVSPLSISSLAESPEGRLRRYVQMFLPVVSIFVAFVVILVLLLVLSFKRNNNFRGNIPGMSPHSSEYTKPLSLFYDTRLTDTCDSCTFQREIDYLVFSSHLLSLILCHWRLSRWCLISVITEKSPLCSSNAFSLLISFWPTVPELTLLCPRWSCLHFFHFLICPMYPFDSLCVTCSEMDITRFCRSSCLFKHFFSWESVWIEGHQDFFALYSPWVSSPSVSAFYDWRHYPCLIPFLFPSSLSSLDSIAVVNITWIKI